MIFFPWFAYTVNTALLIATNLIAPKSSKQKKKDVTQVATSTRTSSERKKGAKSTKTMLGILWWDRRVSFRDPRANYEEWEIDISSTALSRAHALPDCPRSVADEILRLRTFGSLSAWRGTDCSTLHTIITLAICKLTAYSRSGRNEDTLMTRYDNDEDGGRLLLNILRQRGEQCIVFLAEKLAHAHHLSMSSAVGGFL